MALRLRRGTDAERQLITPVEGELIYTTDTKLLYAGDGTTAGGTLVTGSGGAGSTTLNALTDTDLSGASNSDVLTFNSSTNKWESTAVPSAAAIGINDLTGVVITGTVENGNALVYDGSNWAHRPITDFFKEQENYKINIVGDDSTIIVNTDNNTINGSTITASSGFVGSVTGNSTGYHEGDVKGSVFGDDSTLIVDAVGNNISATTVFATNIGNTGTLTVSAGTEVNILSEFGLKLTGETVSGNGYWLEMNSSRGSSSSPSNTAAEDTLSGISFKGYTDNSYKVSGAIVTAWETGATLTAANPASSVSIYAGNDSSGFQIYKFDSKGIFAAPVIQPGVYANDTARDAAIASPAAGMMVFNTTGAKFQGYDGTSWVNLN